MDPRVKRLEDEAGFSPRQARAYVESEGRCGFCGCDLIDTPERYAMGTIDHLLPRSSYPDFEDHTDNHVLACLRCNGLKSGFCGLRHGEDPLDMITKRKRALVERAREHLDALRPRVDDEWRTVCDIIRSSGERG
jgi:hypothetical protein